MARQSKPQKETVARVMHEFKHGELERAQGGKVRDPKQAIAIALHEAGASNQETQAENRRTLAETKKKERAGGTRKTTHQDGPTRAALYDEAVKRKVTGRSRMTKAELQAALRG